MWQSVLKTAGAAAAFAAIHSALASRPAKRAAGRWLGERRRDALYRPLYVAQSVAATAALGAYVLRLPDRELYRVRGPAAGLMRAGQLAGLGLMAWGAREVGVRRLTGLDGLAAWSAGAATIPTPIEAQGPAPDADGGMRATGPFRHSRHPLNLAALPVLWLAPRMTANRLTLAALATAYAVVGSRHEEHRLRAAHGAAYAAYQAGGVPFLLPGPGAAVRASRIRALTRSGSS
jgi:protein-S-isoprenylcysteine O-methyltransferase Ste14